MGRRAGCPTRRGIWVGRLLVSIPWFLDFVAKVDLKRLQAVSTTLRSHNKVVESRSAWIAAPKPRDLALTSVGLALVCVSFGIALLQSLGALPS